MNAESNTTVDIRVPSFSLDSSDLVIRDDEGICEEGLTLAEAIVAVRSRYTADDGVWIDVNDDEVCEDDEDEDDDQDPDTTHRGQCDDEAF